MRIRAAMPSVLRPRPRGAWLGVLGLAAIALHVVQVELAAWHHYDPGQAAAAATMLRVIGCEVVIVGWFWQARIDWPLVGRVALVAVPTAAVGLGFLVLCSIGCHRPGAPRLHAPEDSIASWLLLDWLWCVVFSIGLAIDGQIVGAGRRRRVQS